MPEFRTKIALVRLIDDRISEVVVDDYSYVEAEDIKEIKAANMTLHQGKEYVILIDAGTMTNFSKEARELSASQEYAEFTIAKALLVKSVGHRLVGNFYININKPFIKTKVFSDRHTAIIWLQKQLIESQMFN